MEDKLIYHRSGDNNSNLLIQIGRLQLKIKVHMSREQGITLSTLFMIWLNRSTWITGSYSERATYYVVMKVVENKLRNAQVNIKPAFKMSLDIMQAACMYEAAQMIGGAMEGYAAYENNVIYLLISQIDEQIK